MGTDSFENFEKRLSEWIAHQGFWFQLRHVGTQKHGIGKLLSYIFWVFIRLSIVSIVLGIITFFFLLKRTDTERFREQLKSEIAQKLFAEDLELSGYTRVQGKGSIFRLGAKGTEDSFFTTMEVQNLVIDMGLLDGFKKTWDGGNAEANRISIDLRAGLNSSGNLENVKEVIFGESHEFSLKSLTCNNTNLSWGYYGRAYGKIQNSKMNLTHTGTGWTAHFQGGEFSQNWFNKFEIVNLRVNISSEGIRVTQGQLRYKGGKLELENVTVTDGLNPKPRGKFVLTDVPVEALVPKNAAGIVSGTISSELNLSGSMNSVEGVVLEGPIRLEGADHITVRSGFRPFEALDVIDSFDSYKRVQFDSGEFNLSTGGGKLNVSNLLLSSKNLLAVKGAFTARVPSEEELQNEFGYSEQLFDLDNARVFSEEQMRMSLSKAAGTKEKFDDNIFDDSNQIRFFENLRKNQQLREEAIERKRNLYLFEGELELELKPEIFNRYPTLSNHYPVDKESGRVPMKISMDGNLGQLGLPQANEILKLAEMK